MILTSILAALLEWKADWGTAMKTLALVFLPRRLAIAFFCIFVE